MLSRNLVLIGLSVILSGCAANLPYSAAANLPDTEVAIVKWFDSGGFIIYERHLELLYLDGVSKFTERSDPGFKGKKLFPGNHTLGIYVYWGNICLPLISGVCFNSCHSDVVLDAEAGRTYGYDIEKTNDDVFVKVTDDTGKVASKGLCKN